MQPDQYFLPVDQVEPATPIFPSHNRGDGLLKKRLHGAKASEERETRSALTDENTDDTTNLKHNYRFKQIVSPTIDNGALTTLQDTQTAEQGHLKFLQPPELGQTGNDDKRDMCAS